MIACVGNLFNSDDGFGSLVATQLAKSNLPQNVVIIDFGIRARDLSYELLNEWQTVIIVDAASRGGNPGTLLVIEPEDISNGEAAEHGHSMNPLAAIEHAVKMGAKFDKLLVVACEPENLAEGIGLSPSVELAIPKAVSLIRTLIAQK